MATWTDYLVMAGALALLFASIAFARRVMWEMDEVDSDARKEKR